MDRFVILGGGGFIGTALARKLRDGGNAVLVLNRSGRCQAAGIQAQKVNRNQPARVAAVAEAFAADTLIDMIAFEAPGTLALLAALEGHVRRYVLVSSCDVYAAFGRLLGTEAGPVDNAVLDESAPLRINRYPFRGLIKGREQYDKIPLEHAALAQDGLQSVVLRLPMVFGPGDPQHRYRSLVRIMREQNGRLKMDALFSRWRSPQLHIDDVAGAIAAAARHKDAAGKVFNIGPDRHLSEAARARAFARAMGRRIDVAIEPRGQNTGQENYAQHLLLDSGPLRALTGWCEQLLWPEAYQSVWEWESQALGA